ncbi:aldose 1-epimerase (Galactose mutarotase) [Rhodobacteraceae bacterium KLH11]|nr:aldose 1-epimerase (Galactose mutarotase) [Rhodobacteraceae bacterium KLH11]
MTTNLRPFGHLPDGRQVHQIKLGRAGLVARILTYGAVLQDLRLEGVPHPLVLGWPTLEGYRNSSAYFGAIVGRFANRIGGARFQIDGQTFHTQPNFRGTHTLHGGSDGSAHRIWQIKTLSDDSAELSLELPDEHMGFPGNLTVRATYTITPDDTLSLSICAVSDRPTPCSFAPHSYFNLDGSGTIKAQVLQINAPSYLEVDEDLIPTGRLLPTDDSPLDFRAARQIGAQAIDHNFCVAQAPRNLSPVATLFAPDTGLRMSLETTEPGLQVYSAATLDDPGQSGLDGRQYGPFAGLALEPQGWPDAPNQPLFPSAILSPGSVYQHETTYRFERKS